MSIEIVKPGMLTTIQDIGRRGYQKYGVIESGAMDSFALKAANLLVGNDRIEAAIEITILGPTITFHEEAVIAVCGGDFSPSIDGQSVPLWRAVLVKKGSTLTFGSAKSNIRAYLAVAGGLDLPYEMDSYSTYLRAEIGGYEGRALGKGDQIAIRKGRHVRNDIVSSMTGNEPFSVITPAISYSTRPRYSDHPVIRVMKGSEFDLFSTESKKSLFSGVFKVLPQSDRMGYRLEGPELMLIKPQEMLSEAVAFGTVQVPANGQPIVLMADHQTTGGYPKIAQVISVDLPILAQLNFGSEVSFKEVTLEEAQDLYIKREMDLRLIKHGINKYFK